MATREAVEALLEQWQLYRDALKELHRGSGTDLPFPEWVELQALTGLGGGGE